MVAYLFDIFIPLARSNGRLELHDLPRAIAEEQLKRKEDGESQERGSSSCSQSDAPLGSKE